MSPSEADLRAALREGEGEGDAVDASHIIAAAAGVRARRRTVALSAAAAVVFVAAAATGVAVWTNGGSQPSGPTIAAGPSLHPRTVVVAPGPRRPSVGAMPNDTTAASCAAPPVRRLEPPSVPVGSGPLVPGRVKFFLVCAYPITGPSGSSAATSVVVTGAAARQLAASLANTSPKPLRIACPLIRSTGQLTLVMTGITPDGRRLPPVTATISIPACSSTVSNATVVRYGWQLPPGVASRLQVPTMPLMHGSREPGMPIDLVPHRGGRVSGSPPR